MNVMCSGDFDVKKQVKLVTATAIHVISVDEIVYCESAAEGTIFYCTQKQQLVVDLPFHEIETIMKKFTFWSVSQNCMFNLDFLDEVPIGEEKPVIKLEKYALAVDRNRINMLLDVLRIIG